MGILLDLRRSGLGGTDASAVLGLNPWRTPLQVWSEKRGEAPPVEQTPAMRWGNVLEPVVAEEYALTTGRRLWAPEQVYHHPAHDFLIATPDRLVLGERRGLECKTANGFMTSEWGPSGTDQVPAHYLIQCLHYMAVTGYRVWDLAVLIGGSDFRVYTIHWDEAAGQQLVGRLSGWWQRHMVEGIEPPAMRGDVEWFNRRYPRETLDLMPASVATGFLALEYKVASADVREAEARKEAAAASLKQVIAERQGIAGEDWQITWKANRDTESTDWKGVALALAPQVAPEEYGRALTANATIKPGARVLRFTEKDAKP